MHGCNIMGFLDQGYNDYPANVKSTSSEAGNQALVIVMYNKTTN